MLSIGAAAQDAVESFWEAALSNDFATVERHFPRDFVQAMSECNPGFRENSVSGVRFFADADLQISQIDDSGKPDAVKLFDRWGQGPIELRIVSKYITADKATLGLVLTTAEGMVGGRPEVPQGSEVVTMRLVDGSWRVTSVASPQAKGEPAHPLDGSVATSCRLANEASAVGALRSINTAQVTYASTYPDAGFFARLSQAGPPADGRQPDRQASGLLDGSLACAAEPCVKSGYSFTIRTRSVFPRVSYEAFARPITYGKTGARSFYTSEDGVIRFTTEDRDAIAKDPSVDPGFD